MGSAVIIPTIKIPRSKMKMVVFKITMASFLKFPNFSISNQDEAENWYSRQYTVDPVMTGPEDSPSSCDSENSPLKSDIIFLTNTENIMKEDDPIDKLKALHLLVVAMEQRNASVLKLCHRLRVGDWLLISKGIPKSQNELCICCATFEQSKMRGEAYELVNPAPHNLWLVFNS